MDPSFKPFCVKVCTKLVSQTNNKAKKDTACNCCGVNLFRL